MRSGSRGESGPKRSQRKCPPSQSQSKRLTSNNAQAYFVYDSKKAGSMTTSHLRFGKKVLSPQIAPGTADVLLATQTIAGLGATSSTGILTRQLNLPALTPLGPLFIAAALIPVTRGLFAGWVRAVTASALVTLTNQVAVADGAERVLITRETLADLFARDAGQRSHIRRLTRLGLIEFEAVGHDIDGETERDVEIYKLTAAGIAAAAHTED